MRQPAKVLTVDASVDATVAAIRSGVLSRQRPSVRDENHGRARLSGKVNTRGLSISVESDLIQGMTSEVEGEIVADPEHPTRTLVRLAFPMPTWFPRIALAVPFLVAMAWFVMGPEIREQGLSGPRVVPFLALFGGVLFLIFAVVYVATRSDQQEIASRIEASLRPSG